MAFDRPETVSHPEDPYSDGTCDWWHLSEPSPELHEAVADGWIPAAGTVLDVGCGLGTELGWLVERGHTGIGIDLSEVACTRAHAQYPRARFMRADVRHLPFDDGSFEIALDRGCFHYLPPNDWPRYESELRRMLKPGGRLLLRASLRAAGVRNDITEDVIRSTFAGWDIHRLERAEIPTDTRLLEVIVARLERCKGSAIESGYL